MQIVSLGENLHEVSNLFSGKSKNKIISFSSVKLAPKVVMINKGGTFYGSEKVAAGDGSKSVPALQIFFHCISVIGYVPLSCRYADQKQMRLS